MARQLAPPAHVPLSDEDMHFWLSVLAEFPKSDWTSHRLELAAMMARTMANLEQAQRQCRLEGFTVASNKGMPMPHPLAAVARGFASNVLALRRSLALHANATPSGNQKVATTNARAKEIEARAPLVKDGHDDLIARP